MVYEWRLKPMAEDAIYKRLDGLGRVDAKR